MSYLFTSAVGKRTTVNLKVLPVLPSEKTSMSPPIFWLRLLQIERPKPLLVGFKCAFFVILQNGLKILA